MTLAHSYDIIIDHTVGVTDHGKYFVYGIKVIKKLSILLSKVKLPGSRGYENHTAVHT